MSGDHKHCEHCGDDMCERVGGPNPCGTMSNDAITIRIDGVPKAMGRPRATAFHGKVRMHNPTTAVGWRERISIAFRPYLPPTPHEGPLRIDIDFHFPRPKRLYRKKDPDGPIWHTAKPDRDNSDKSVLDELEAMGFLRNDSQACNGRIRKFYHAKDEIPHAVITVAAEKEQA